MNRETTNKRKAHSQWYEMIAQVNRKIESRNIPNQYEKPAKKEEAKDNTSSQVSQKVINPSTYTGHMWYHTKKRKYSYFDAPKSPLEGCTIIKDGMLCVVESMDYGLMDRN